MNILTVSQLNMYSRMLLEGDSNLKSVCVKGEISNLVFHSSGHLYFSLKDGYSSVKAVMFRGAAVKLPFRPENGMAVIASGSVTLYEKDGTYQICVNMLSPDGKGNEYLKLQALKEKLEAKGYFDSARKKQLPYIPDSVGLITSPTGAAIKDFFAVISKRWPGLNILFYPVSVQGNEAAGTIIKGIRYFNNNPVDLIVITRGGGSKEDLYVFNDESVCDAVFESRIPIVSAVGHEIDYTLTDFTADFRAPTPSAAAESIAPDRNELQTQLNLCEDMIYESLNNYLSDLKSNLLSSYKDIKLSAGLNKFASELTVLQRDLINKIERLVAAKKSEVQTVASVLSAVSPLNTMARGYSVAQKNGAIIKTVKDLSIDDNIEILFKDGKADCCVKEIGK